MKPDVDIFFSFIPSKFINFGKKKKALIRLVTGMNIWQGVRFIEKFNSQEELWLDMINSLQVRIRILSKEVGYLF